jgi:inosine/xanthosine triphosphate pyrophosphatase family protein
MGKHNVQKTFAELSQEDKNKTRHLIKLLREQEDKKRELLTNFEEKEN